MIRRPTDQNRRPCLLPCPEGVATGSRPAERPPTLKQQVCDTQMWHKHTLIEREIMRPPLPITHLTIHKGVIMFFVCVCAAGDDMEHEQDTVLQLQEVIEQLRNVFPSEPGESARAARIAEDGLFAPPSPTGE